MLRLVDLYGFRAYKKCVSDMGRMIQDKGNSSSISYNWFLASGEEKIGKNRSQTFLVNEYKNNVNVKQFVDAVKEDEVRDKINNSKRKLTELSTEALISGT